MNKILGIDYGTKKIGLALAINETARPLETLQNQENHPIGSEAIEKIVQIISDEKIDLVIIGLPESINSQNEQETRGIRAFGNRLKKAFNTANIIDIRIEYIDESYTSKEAKQKSAEMDISKKHRESDDAIAACQIIYRYLEPRT